MKTIFGFCAAAALSATAAVSQVVTYDCDMTSPSVDGFIEGKFIFSVNTSKKTAAVLDGTIYYVNDKKPILTSINTANPGVLNIKWDLRNVPTQEGGISVGYSANIRPEKGRLTVRANVKGYDNKSKGSGRCKVVNGQSLF